MSDLRGARRVTIRMLPDTVEKLDALAFLHDSTIHETVRRLIEDASDDPAVAALIAAAQQYRQASTSPPDPRRPESPVTMTPAT